MCAQRCSMHRGVRAILAQAVCPAMDLLAAKGPRVLAGAASEDGFPRDGTPRRRCSGPGGSARRVGRGGSRCVGALLCRGRHGRQVAGEVAAAHPVGEPLFTPAALRGSRRTQRADRLEFVRDAVGLALAADGRAMQGLRAAAKRAVEAAQHAAGAGEAAEASGAAAPSIAGVLRSLGCGGPLVVVLEQSGCGCPSPRCGRWPDDGRRTTSGVDWVYPMARLGGGGQPGGLLPVLGGGSGGTRHLRARLRPPGPQGYPGASGWGPPRGPEPVWLDVARVWANFG